MKKIFVIVLAILTLASCNMDLYRSDAITEEELAAHGVNIVIYANHLTRSAFPAMQKTAEDILKYHRAKEADERLMPIGDIITLIEEL